MAQQAIFEAPGQEERRHRGGFVFPLVLVTIGIVLLLNNLGVVPWNVWGNIWRLWPVLLIAAGLDVLIGRRSAVGSLFGVAFLVIIIGAFVWASTNVSWGGGAMISRTVNQALEGAGRAQITIDHGVGDLRIAAGAESASLIEGTVALPERADLAPQFSRSGDTAYYRLGTSNLTNAVLPFGQINGAPVWDLRVNRDVPLVLNLHSGVGKSVVDLTNMRVTSLTVNGGVGENIITLPSKGQVQVSVDGGIGNMTVLIPRGMAAHVSMNGGLGGISVNGDYRQSGRDYTSPNYESAQDRVDLRVNGGIGKITISESGIG